jgi:hypothetical protein
MSAPTFTRTPRKIGEGEDEFTEYVRSLDSQEPEFPAVIVEMDDLCAAAATNMARRFFGLPTWTVVFDCARVVESDSNDCRGITLNTLARLDSVFEGVEFEDVSQVTA